MKAYLAGPMSNIPQYNFPEFYRVTALLRAAGWDIVSPAEMDAETSPEIVKDALASQDGVHTAAGVAGHTWGDLLARDVKLIADGGIEAIIFLPNWSASKGAKLEATVGLLKMIKFFEMHDDVPVETDPCEIAAEIYMATIEKFTPSESADVH